jgi:ligand-binding sensor domain-containing protein
VLLGSEGAGVWRSEDGGATFSRADQGMTNVRAVALARDGRSLYVAVNHAGPASGVYVTRDGGRSFDGPRAVPTVLDLAAGAGGVWAATEQGLYRAAGDGFERVAELGAARVEQVLTAGRRVVARTAQKLWQSSGGDFAEVPYRHGPPRAAALDGAALWVADADGLYRLSADSNHSISVPYRGGAVQAVDGLLVWSGKQGVFTRADTAAPWQDAGSGPTRAVETGAPTCPLLLLGADSALLLSAVGVASPLPLPVPARDVVAAAALDGRLWLGTSGHGLLSRALDCVQ